MAPPAEKDVSQADADFLFHVLTATDELKVNWKTVATAAGISAYNNANRKFHVLVEKRGFKFKDGKIITKEEAENAIGAAKIATPGRKSTGNKKTPAEEGDKTAGPTTPSKPPAKKAKSKATPKKRKFEETTEAGDNDKDAAGNMEIVKQDGIESEDKGEVKID